jgi:hypothetical protein
MDTPGIEKAFAGVDTISIPPDPAVRVV